MTAVKYRGFFAIEKAGRNSAERQFPKTTTEQFEARRVITAAFGVVQDNHAVIGQCIDALDAAIDAIAAVDDDDMLAPPALLRRPTVLSVLIQIAIDEFRIKRFVFYPRLVP